MNQELEALARRAVACKGWRWMAGMRMLRPANEESRLPMRIVQVGARQSVTNTRIGDVGFIAAHEPPGAAWCGGYERDDVPDLTDPATLGCVLALVREAWGLPACPVHSSSIWAVRANIGEWLVGFAAEHATAAAALTSALASAP